MTSNSARSPLAGLALPLALGLAACSMPGSSFAGATSRFAPAGHPAKAQTPIEHVIVVIQENRSFDNLFSTFPGADGAVSGKSTLGYDIPLAKVPLNESANPGHAHAAFVTEYDGGKMDGFNLVEDRGRHGVPNGAYQYVDPATIAPYWDLARRYRLADHMFQTQSSGSFTAHQDLIAGGTAIDESRSVIDFPSEDPWGCDAPVGTVTTLIDTSGTISPGQGPFPCFEFPTLRDLLDAHGVSWAYYTPPVFAGGHVSFGGLWNAFDAIAAVRHGPEWKSNVRSPETKFFNDVAAGKLAGVTWIVPDESNSDHPGSWAAHGPSWVGDIVNAVGESKFWDSTAIVVVWDDWGGFYDHYVPPQLDSQGLGFRVPMIVVSAYSTPGKVVHAQLEFGSILKFIENNWRLGRLGTTDVRAATIRDAFNFAAPPAPFVSVATTLPASYFIHQRPSLRPVDDE